MTAEVFGQQSATRERSLRILQRVVFPDGDLDVVPLYVETHMDRGAAELAAEMATEQLTGRRAPGAGSVPVANAAVGEAQSIIRFGADVPAYPGEDAGPRRSAVISEGRRVSFATYFNAFPASYWRRWTSVDSVTLRIRVAGESTIVLYRSTAKGFSHPVETITVQSDDPETVERTLPLAPFIDGGWYWFDIVAGPRPTTLIEAEWLALTEPAPAGRVSIGITTFNRPEYMLDGLRTLGEAAEVHDLLDRVYVVDQGTNRVRNEPGFADAAKKLGDLLQIIEQGNIGGSGGFARSMDETVQAGQSDYVLLMDDDVKFDPEGILRAATFADLARRPTIVGGHMFSMYDRSLLHAFAEAIAPYKWWWGIAPNTKGRHDFARRNLRNTPWLHRRADSDYNGWWMCLIPTQIIREIGLALPVFIKWDDAEYGVRARAHGYPTVSLPGVASWQVPWDDKDDARDWQAYYHLRNRLVTALLHSPEPHGGKLLSESMERQLQSLLSMQYSTAALRLLAIEDVLTGPDHLHRDIGTKLKQLREYRLEFPDAQGAADIESFPPARRRAPEAVKDSTTPTNRVNLLTKAASGMARQFRPVREGARKRPQMALPFQDASWWVLVKLDSALVSTAEGTTAAWYQRDPKLFRSLGLRSMIAHRKLRRQWARLAAEYRSAAAGFNSPEKWRETFAASADDRPSGP
ncbi:MAG: glycosyltransferase [Streptosporangiaceae bacterium]|jgi:galactofuranosylgalactofuranosylrhamnosyl-N-acetylglucosaminyl-diphospho-decaprenol beta-1,5/1,6-galactofuranosyltransferase